MKSVLILGGYGGFGSRLSRRLALAGWHVIVSGRDVAKAQKLADTLPNAVAARADREGDIAALLRKHQPHLLVDAAGPFQDCSYHVPQACIDARVPYLDLADARTYVCGIGILDLQAKDAGISVISGASSVPALSGAVARHLAQNFDEVHEIDMEISASSKASAGLSVTTAILSYVGKPMALWNGRYWQKVSGWSDPQWRDFKVADKTPLRRLVALADIPDHQLLPERFAGKPKVSFRAGPEFAFQTLGLWLLGWLVRLNFVRSLSVIAGFAKRLQTLLSGFGSDRSAMRVAMIGTKKGVRYMRRWDLLAEDGDGPEIPVMAAQLLAEHILAGEISTGAIDAGTALELEQFSPVFKKLSITTAFSKHELPSLYRRVMGAGFEQLPGPVRAMHSVFGSATATGTAIVKRGSSLPAKLVCTAMRFPPEGQFPLSVKFVEKNGTEHWTRNFGGHVFSSQLSKSGRHLVERFGPMRFHFDLPANAKGLTMVMRRWSIFGIPMPLCLAPRSEAREWADGDNFCLDVPIDLPLIGRVVHYQGTLNPPECD